MPFSHPITLENGHVVPVHNVQYSFVSMIKRKLCENKNDAEENPLRNVYDTVLGCPTEMEPEPNHTELASPEILKRALNKVHITIEESEQVLLNVSKCDSDSRPYGNAMQALGELHDIDVQLLDKIIGLQEGSIQNPYGSVEEVVFEELIAIVDYHATLIVTYKSASSIDVDTLRTHLQPEIAKKVNTAFIKIHKYLIAEGIIDIEDIDEENKKVVFTQNKYVSHVFKRFKQLQDGIDTYIENENEKVIIFALRFIKYLMKAYAEMYSDTGIFKYDPCEEMFRVKDEDWDHFHHSMWCDVDGNNEAEGDMLEHLHLKTISYINDATYVTTRATMIVTIGLIQYDYFCEEINDTMLEFEKIDHIEHDSDRSRQTEVCQHMYNLVSGYNEVTFLEIYSINNLREKRDFMVEFVVNGVATTLTLKRTRDELIKDWRKTKEHMLKCLIGFVQELEVMFDLDQQCKGIKQNKSNTIIHTTAIAAGTLAFLVCAFFLFNQKKESKQILNNNDSH